jgi:hypothetical protein
MPYIGKTPTAVPLTSSDITNDIITEAKIVDDAIENEHLNDNIISGQTELASEPSDTDEFLVSDAGTLKRIDYSLIKGGGITMADQWRLTAHTNQGSNAILSTNWERNDSTGFGYIGSGMSESSGVFSFPSTGFYLVTFEAKFYLDGNDTAEVWIQVTTNNSSYSGVAVGNSTNTSGSANDGYSSSSSTIVDVTDTSNVKVNFLTGSMAGNTKMLGNSTYNLTTATFIRLGDT